MSQNTSTLVGTWTLVSCEHHTAEGKTLYPWGQKATGQLIYTPDGFMSVFIMKPGRARFQGESLFDAIGFEKAEAMDNCLSYAGRYRVQGNEVIHVLDFSLFPNWIGTEQPRYFELSGDRLLLTSPSFKTEKGSQTAHVLWQRMK